MKNIDEPFEKDLYIYKEDIKTNKPDKQYAKQQKGELEKVITENNELKLWVVEAICKSKLEISAKDCPEKPEPAITSMSDLTVRALPDWMTKKMQNLH